MGIPSYYKKLIDTIPGLISKGHPSGDIQWLFMDFNCLIYHCLYREDTPTYPGEEGKDEWEVQLLECVVKYCLKVVKEVDPKKGIFIAVDGVVPMAKMRQQRLRRFKSAWLSSEEGGAKWDTNAITPGTAFMRKLRTRLEAMIAKHGKKTWQLSSSDEPGEGEHKIVTEWRTGKYKGNFAVYGLDADLIVLSILGRETCGLNNQVYLFREEVNAGKITYDQDCEEVFEWFSINALRDWLASAFDVEKQPEFILNYCFTMSVLGNDFLPSSLGLKIRDDGHSELLELVQSLTTKGVQLIHPDTLEISSENLQRFFEILAKDESSHIIKYISKKKMMSRNLVGDVQLPVGDNNWPLCRVEEDLLLQGQKELATDWKEKYIGFLGFPLLKSSINQICKEYLYGIQWIWAYYNGRSQICFNWYYPFSLPPLWEWISSYLKEDGLAEFPAEVKVLASDIRPVEQLSLVLPLVSWYLIPPCPERSLPKWAPQFFPDRFGFESVGKRYFWECECLIPLPSILEVKQIVTAFT